MNIRRCPFRIAILVILSATPAAVAQTIPGVTEDFSGLGQTRPSISVIDQTGKETNGRLLRFDANSLTMTAGDRDLTFDRQEVAKVYQRGDSLKNGMTIGLVTGAALGFAAGVSTTECGGFFQATQPCTGGERARLGAVMGGVFGALGMGIGVGI